MHLELEKLMRKERTAFSSKLVFSADGDFVSVFLRDASCFAERVDDTLTIYKDDDTKELVGCKLKGIQTLLKQMDSSGIVVQDEFRMTVLFWGWATANKIQPENVDILHYLIDQFGNVTARYSTLDAAIDEHNGSRCI